MVKNNLQNKFVQPRNVNRAIQLMLITAVCVALLNIFSKQLVDHLPLSMAIFLRAFLPFIIILPFAHKFSFTLKKQWRLHALRGLIVAIYIYAWFFYLQYASVFDATLLFSTGPLFIPFLSLIFLHRPLRIKVFFSALIGLLGVAIVIKPDQGVFHWAALAGLLSGVGNAASQVCLHKLSEKQHPVELMFNVFFWCSIFYLIPMLYSLRFVQATMLWNSKLILILIPLIILSFINQTIRAKAYQYVRNPASIMPLIYLAIPIAALLDWLFYRQGLTWNKILGALIIIFSVVLISTLKPKGKKL